jgi:phosphoglucomutase
MNENKITAARQTIADSFVNQSVSEKSQREDLLNRCTLSVSGLRFICFADENDINPHPDQVTVEFVMTAVDEFAKMIPLKTKIVWLGMDARPTGPVFINIAYNILKAKGFDVKITYYAPIPEIMAACHQSGADAFCYFTASHNPAGHNGLKLGFADGKVLAKKAAGLLIESIKEKYLSGNELNSLWKVAPKTSETEIINSKEASLEYYRNFSIKTISKITSQDFCNGVKTKVESGTSVVIDFNGSSRLSSIDQSILKDCGFNLELMGTEIGVFNHAIIPEGKSLDDAQNKMDELLKAGKNVFFALVPDCDGDRGNLIIPINGVATKLKAQETFALCALAEVCSLRASGYNGPLAIAVNGPTSLRLENILEPFNVTIERAEVGEANVLAKVDQLKAKGLVVPISGEGSNGGNIIDRTTVRDPMMTMLSLIKFIYPSSSDTQSASEYYFSKRSPDWGSSVLEKVISTFPNWYSTDAFETEAIMPVPQIEHEVLKSNYEKLFPQKFKEDNAFWQKAGIDDFCIQSIEGTETIPGPGGRPAPGKGGFKIELLSKGTCLGFMWMRGSGTEPVFRVLVDWHQNNETAIELLNYHRKLIELSSVE